MICRRVRTIRKGLDSNIPVWDDARDMTTTVQKIAEEVKSLPDAELDEFLAWLADYELAHVDPWDKEMERDSLPGGRLDVVLNRVRRDIAAGRTKPLDEVIDNS